MVTGVLPTALESATKAIQILLLTGKEYVCIMRLHSEVPKDDVQRVLTEFVGDIYQRPPLRSSVRRVIRIRTIYYIKVLEITDALVLFRVGCQAGTYIRKLCHDVGQALGTGAHMNELRRTRTGPFTENDMLVSLYDLRYASTVFKEKGDETYLRQVIQPIERSLAITPKLWIRDSAVNAICHGADLAIPGVLKLESGIKPGDMTAILTQKGEVVALAEAQMSTDNILNQNRGIAVKTKRVIMDQDTYPTLWKKHKTGLK